MFVISPASTVHAISHTKKGTAISHRNPHLSAGSGSRLSIVILFLFLTEKNQKCVYIYKKYFRILLMATLLKAIYNSPLKNIEGKKSSSEQITVFAMAK